MKGCPALHKLSWDILGCNYVSQDTWNIMNAPQRRKQQVPGYLVYHDLCASPLWDIMGSAKYPGKLISISGFIVSPVTDILSIWRYLVFWNPWLCFPVWDISGYLGYSGMLSILGTHGETSQSQVSGILAILGPMAFPCLRHPRMVVFCCKPGTERIS